MDDLPGLALVEGQRGLATTTTVVSATSDGHAVRAAGLPVSNRSASWGAEERVVALAREVAAAGLERSSHAVVDISVGVRVGLGLEGGRACHLHMSLGQTGEPKGESSGFDTEELHVCVGGCGC